MYQSEYFASYADALPFIGGLITDGVSYVVYFPVEAVVEVRFKVRVGRTDRRSR